MMTLDEAIKYAEEKYESQMQNAKVVCQLHGNYAPGYLKHYKCAEEHRQLADWLIELREYREGKR